MSDTVKYKLVDKEGFLECSEWDSDTVEENDASLFEGIFEGHLDSNGDLALFTGSYVTPFELYQFCELVTDGQKEQSLGGWSDKHYNHVYRLTDEEKESGEVRLDVYKVSKVWKVGSKDDSGALWHILKTIPRFGEKNTVEREILALHNQVKGLARSFGVELN